MNRILIITHKKMSKNKHLILNVLFLNCDGFFVPYLFIKKFKRANLWFRVEILFIEFHRGSYVIRIFSSPTLGSLILILLLSA